MLRNDSLIRELAGQLGGRHQGIANADDFTCAAVLMPLLLYDGELSILFEVRSAQLKWQPGEICFPGGRIEPSDNNPQAAAVRETTEELGIPADKLTVLGPLDYIASPIGVMLHPYVAYVDTPVKIVPNTAEVAETFCVPLSWLLNVEPQTATMELATRPKANFPYELLKTYPSDWKRRISYTVMFYQYQQYTIWGLSARVLHNLLAICRQTAAGKKLTLGQ